MIKISAFGLRLSVLPMDLIFAVIKQDEAYRVLDYFLSLM
jgi:hypothetical protein